MRKTSQGYTEETYSESIADLEENLQMITNMSLWQRCYLTPALWSLPVNIFINTTHTTQSSCLGFDRSEHSAEIHSFNSELIGKKLYKSASMQLFTPLSIQTFHICLHLF